MPRRPTGVTQLPSGRWLARYRDAAGKERTKTFDTAGEGGAWRAAQLAAVASGTWTDPADGRVTFREYAEKWRASAGHREQSAATVESRLRLHVYPTLGDRPLADLRHSELRAWVSQLEKTLAPWTAYGVHAIARTVLNSAVADRHLAASPFARIPLPAVTRREPVVPYTVAEVRRLVEAARGPYRTLFALGAATGLRGGELLGLELASVDFLRRTVRVERQLVWHRTAPGAALRPAWGPPKTPKSYRVLDVPTWALDELAAHLAARPAVELTLPVVDTPREKVRTGRLVFTTRTGQPIRRTGLASTWHHTVRRAKLPAAKGGPHALRHHVASLLIDAGESVKVVQAQLGHATAAETWDTYAHLFPDAEGRVRSVLERAWQDEPEAESDGQAGEGGV